MPPEERDLAFLRDMLSHAYEVQTYVADVSFADYLADRPRRRMVERVLQIVGEAANRVSPATRAAYPHIAWQPIIGQRHVLAHEYGNILHDMIWTAATVHIPTLIEQLERLTAIDPSRSGWEGER